MELRDYSVVATGYWALTLTDGALRMLVLLHFHELGYSPASLALLFLLYEFMGILTNLLGGWVGARRGLNLTLLAGLTLQTSALVILSFHVDTWAEWVSVTYVMGAQALSGVAKDLTKMSSKSAVKFVAGEGSLFRLVAIVTGSKNTLKGVGFFLGAALLAGVGFAAALRWMAGGIAVTAVAVVVLLKGDIGRATTKPPLRSVLAKSAAINRLSAARFFLFGSRDIWFVVALPVFLDDILGWSFERTGAFLAAWVIGYGIVQALAPRALRRSDNIEAARSWALALGFVTAAIAIGATINELRTTAVVGGLIVFGVVFAVNSSLHSYLILAYTGDDEVSMDVGFYYSANAAGRLLGTLLSGVLYGLGGLEVAMWGSTTFVVLTWLVTLRLPPIDAASTEPPGATAG